MTVGELLGAIVGFSIPVLAVVGLYFLLRRFRKPKREVLRAEVKRNPGVAAVLSFFWCGLGQIYNGQILRGILLMFLYGLLIAVALAYSRDFGVILFVFPFILWIIGMVDANNTAKRMNIQLSDFGKGRNTRIEQNSLCVNCWISGDCEREKEAIKKRKTITDCRGYVPEDKRIG